MKKKIIAVVVIIIIIGFALCTYFIHKHISSVLSYEPQQNLQAPIEIPSDGIVSIEEAQNLKKPQVILFYVDWCGYCRKFMPVFGKFAKKYDDKYSFVAINCDNPENKELVEKFHIIGFPLVFIVDNEIGHNFTLHPAATGNEKIMTEELENYIKVKKKYSKY